SAVRFECRCTHERVAGMLRALGRAEVESVLAEQGAVTVTCDFCNRPYRYGPGEVERLFSESGTLH
ncbi:MAG TPA: Hsp33 family molecular chaperone HslO, partial [Steroidobacteraceae bacterium]|nr:Hsp33 family molecular chaperone HslO [Steroidobacteraceae bacterium]